MAHFLCSAVCGSFSFSFVRAQILHLIFWLPSFAVDYGLNNVLSAQNIAYVNVALNFVIFFGLARLAPFAIAYVKRQMRAADEEAEEAEQEQAEDLAAEQQEHYQSGGGGGDGHDAETKASHSSSNNVKQPLLGGNGRAGTDS